MNYFPFFARSKGMPCLVVGGGSVGTRKTKLLLRAGAAVTVCAPDTTAELRALAAAGRLQIEARTFSPELLAGRLFVIAATGDTAVNCAVAAAADNAGVFCNVVDDRELSTAILPAMIDRSPVVVAVSSGGESPVLATRVRQQIETTLAPRLGDLAALTGRWRAAVIQRFTTLDERRGFWQRLLDSPAAEQALNGDAVRADQLTDEMLRATADDHGAGLASIVGAGPGDPELLTLKAIRALNSADVVVHDRLVARSVLDYARKDADFISVGKQAGQPSISQEEINALLVKLVREGKRVCRIKGGDPFIFGRGGEEIEALENAGLPWQVVPGITAAAGCAAAAGIPLTHREVARAVTLATAHSNDGSEPDWGALASDNHTAVFYMGVRRLAATCDALIAAGRATDTPAVLIENGTTDKQRLVRGTLEDIPERARREQVKSPALLMVGAVVGSFAGYDSAGIGQDVTDTVADNGSHDWSPVAPGGSAQQGSGANRQV